MQITKLPDNVDHIEYRGATYDGAGAEALLASLAEKPERDEVSVVFKGGVRTSLPKFEDSIGGESLAVRGGKVFF